MCTIPKGFFYLPSLYASATIYIKKRHETHKSLYQQLKCKWKSSLMCLMQNSAKRALWITLFTQFFNPSKCDSNSSVCYNQSKSSIFSIEKLYDAYPQHIPQFLPVWHETALSRQCSLSQAQSSLSAGACPGPRSWVLGISPYGLGVLDELHTYLYLLEFRPYAKQQDSIGYNKVTKCWPGLIKPCSAAF